MANAPSSQTALLKSEVEKLQEVSSTALAAAKQAASQAKRSSLDEDEQKLRNEEAIAITTAAGNAHAEAVRAQVLTHKSETPNQAREAQHDKILFEEILKGINVQLNQQTGQAQITLTGAAAQAMTQTIPGAHLNLAQLVQQTALQNLPASAPALTVVRLSDTETMIAKADAVEEILNAYDQHPALPATNSEVAVPAHRPLPRARHGEVFDVRAWSREPVSAIADDRLLRVMKHFYSLHHGESALSVRSHLSSHTAFSMSIALDAALPVFRQTIQHPLLLNARAQHPAYFDSSVAVMQGVAMKLKALANGMEQSLMAFNPRMYGF
ncbi:MAG: hypothetical protein K0S08_168 [Gammaproteobacteria bacterium]|jgi:hypothetical protein|nr:hypothetical protein [Gammaproteobacteria bacterium]